MTITIFEANTGDQIASASFYGGNVDACPSTIPSVTHEDIKGDKVEYEQVKDWLLSYLLK